MTPEISSADQTLEELAGRFDHWRRTRAHCHEPIPVALWDQAVALCQHLPQGQVARRLNLSPTDLKNRRLGQPKRRRVKKPTREALPAFVELPCRAGASVADKAGRGGTFRVEFERPDGTRMRLAFESGHSPSLADLVGIFLGRPGC